MVATPLHDLTEKTALAATDEFYLVQSPYASGDDRRTPLSSLASYLAKSTLAAGALTTSQPMTLTQTWNAAGVTFAGLSVDITDTASAAASAPMRARVGGSDILNLRKDGLLSIVGGLNLGSGGDVGIARNAAGVLEINSGTAGTLRDLLARNAAFTGGTLTASTPLVVSQTWNNGAVTFVGASIDITSTASAAGSLPFRVRVGGTEIFRVKSDGEGFLSSNFSTGGSIEAVNYILSSSVLGIYARNDSASYHLGAADDVVLFRDAAGVLAQRNGLNIQEFRLYSTFTAADNYARLVLRNSGGVNYILAEGAGATAGGKELLIGGATIYFTSATLTNWWQISSGHLLASTDNSFDIGASGATRPRNIYNGTQFLSVNGSVSTPGYSFAGAPNTGIFYGSDLLQISHTGTAILSVGPVGLLFPTDNTYDIGASGATRPRNIFVGDSGTFGGNIIATNFIANASGVVVWTGRAVISSPADGIITLFNNVTADFGRLQFGGTSSSFPALKRSSAILQARLADDSDFALIQGTYKHSANAAADAALVSTHSIIIQDAAGASYKVMLVAV